MRITYIFFLIVLASFEVKSQNEPEPYEFDFQCDCPHDLNSYPDNVQLNHVQFHDHLPMIYDDRSTISEIHYYSLSDRYPVAYVSSQMAKVSAMFTSTCSHPLYIYGRTANKNNVNFFFPVRYVTPTGAGDYYYPISEATEEFEDDLVNAFIYGGGFVIEWFVSPTPVESIVLPGGQLGFDGGQIVGASNNALYVTHENPITNAQGNHQMNDTELFLSTIANSCIAAEGNSGENGIVDAIYALFQSRYIQQRNDLGGRIGLLGYWSDPALAQGCSSTYDLYNSGVGRSFNFAELMTDMIRVQGLHHSQIVRVTYENEDVSVLSPDLTSDLIANFINDDWTGYNQNSIFTTHAPGLLPFTIPSSPLDIPSWITNDLLPFVEDPLSVLNDKIEETTYLFINNQKTQNEENKFQLDNDATADEVLIVNEYINLVKLNEQEGLLAQGEVWQGLESDEKPKKFSRLFLVENNGKYYDPSYGTEIFNSISNWETYTVKGYGLTINEMPLVKKLVPLDLSVHNLHYIHLFEDNSSQDTTVD